MPGLRTKKRQNNQRFGARIENEKQKDEKPSIWGPDLEQAQIGESWTKNAPIWAKKLPDSKKTTENKKLPMQMVRFLMTFFQILWAKSGPRRREGKQKARTPPESQQPGDW